MDIRYFQKINNTHGAKNKQETDLFLLNRHVNDAFDDSIDYHWVKRNGEDFELLITKSAESRHKKRIKSRPGQPINLGDIIEWMGARYIVNKLDLDSKSHISGDMWLCNLVLTWQNSEGEILQRFCYAENLTKYSTGIRGNSTIMNPDYQYGINIALDDDTRVIMEDQRFIIDYPDIYPPATYKVSTREVMLDNYSWYGRGGMITLVLTKTEFDSSKDKLVKAPDGEDVWVGGYVSLGDSEPTPPVEDDNSIEIEFSFRGNAEIISGGNYKTFTATAKDKDKNVIDDFLPVWTVTCLPEFDDYIEYYTDEQNRLVLSAKYNTDMIGTIIKLDVVDESYKASSSIYVTIGGGI